MAAAQLNPEMSLLSWIWKGRLPILKKKQKCKGVFHMYFENKISKRELKNKEIYKAIKKNESSLVGIESS